MALGVYFFILEGSKMFCDRFKCVNMDGDECSQIGGDCIGDMCEDFGECRTCQKLEGPDDCATDQQD